MNTVSSVYLVRQVDVALQLLTESLATAMSTFNRIVVVKNVKNTARNIEKTELKFSRLNRPKSPSKMA